MEDLVANLPTPKVVWMMVPAGDAAEGVINELKVLLNEGVFSF